MPFLMFEKPPPTKFTSGDIGSKIRKEENIITTTESAEDSRPSKQEVDSVEDDLGTKYPVVKLDSDKISDSTAGRLATSLLGHVLFLKNQVPFPVMQLGRIPASKTNTRAAKQRAELLASYDTISSHLDTTFSALSTALARCSGHKSELSQVHLAILVGPSVTTAKSKVILGIDGLETRIWGVRAPEIQQQQDDGDSETSDDDGNENHDDSDESEETPGESDDEADGSDGSREGPEDSGDDEEDEDVENDTDDGDSDVCPSKPTSPPPSPLYVSHAEEQKFLQKADRLLSRTLAAADADGKGISSELSPTHTHILIRAPRRFNHPAWVPRQNVTNSLDMALQDFQHNSGLRSVPLEEISSRPKHSKKSPVEGVWITTREGLHHSTSSQDASAGVDLPDIQQLEEDEMIWWSWDGNFQGFSDW